MSPDEFRAARKRLRLTQRELAERLGISRETVIRIEGGTCSGAAYAARLPDVAAMVAAEIANKFQLAE